MSKQKEFVSIIESEFPANRLTFQKVVPTFHPENAEEAAKLLKLANKHRQQLFITGYGNNIDPVREPFTNMVAVRTDRLNKLDELACEDFYVRAGSGYPIREINRHLAEKNLYFPHSALPYVGSIGGAVAINLSAELNGHDLPIKKYLIMAEIVTAEGEIIRPGSVCFKSVSGYDIVKMFAPSWGLLGLIVTATFRVMPSTAIEEYAGMKMKAVNRDRFLAGLDESNKNTDAAYSRKIKNKFDPAHVLPIVRFSEELKE